MEKTEEVKSIVESLTDEEKWFIGDTGSWSRKNILIYRKIFHQDNIPIAFIDIYKFPNDFHVGYICIAVRKEYRHQGIAKKLIKDAKSKFYFQSKFLIDNLGWLVDNINIPSVKLAESLGFKIKRKDEKESLYLHSIFTKMK